MFRGRLTLMVVPDTKNQARQISFPRYLIPAAIAVVAVLAVGCAFFASQFFGNQVDQFQLTRLETENEELSAKYEELRWHLAEVDARYDDLVQKEVAIRTIFGLPEIDNQERQLGIGGPDPVDLSSLSNSEILAYNTEVEVDRLLRLSSFELEKYSEVESELNSLQDRLAHTPSIWPTKGWLTSGYGWRDDPFTGSRQFHSGLDLSGNKGTPIIATADGRVKRIVTYRDLGKTLVIDHGYGFVTRYGHLSKVDVAVGQKVKRGEIIARMGNSGARVTGPHLHYEVWRNNKSLNPRDFILNKK
ncbi:peptidoglycan DD-metalloendopeptidase family protein [candidate division GN15 bacterium]|nr:peptidoglycan DD-metalloendopeptidase family protein [candidate division GN15 bacterium]